MCHIPAGITIGILKGFDLIACFWELRCTGMVENIWQYVGILYLLWLAWAYHLKLKSIMINMQQFSDPVWQKGVGVWLIICNSISVQAITILKISVKSPWIFT